MSHIRTHPILNVLALLVLPGLLTGPAALERPAVAAGQAASVAAPGRGPAWPLGRPSPRP
jgi:hypothetical protein